MQFSKLFHFFVDLSIASNNLIVKFKHTSILLFHGKFNAFNHYYQQELNRKRH